MKNKKVIQVQKDGKDASVEIIECFELDNGKTFVIYQFENEEEICVSSLVKEPDAFVLDEVTDEEMQVIEKMLKDRKEEV